jgi:uncharacterized membrane protein
MKAAEVFTPEACKVVEESIRQAELRTSGEIRLYVEDRCPEEVLDRAAFMFETLKMHATAQRNGVLIYLAVADRQFAIIGDVGINSKVPTGFWDSVKDEMLAQFRNGELPAGIVAGVRAAGEKLAAHFPRRADDRDELSNKVVMG